MQDNSTPEPSQKPHVSYQVLSAGAGVRWFKHAVQLFKASPIAWLSCALVMFFALLAILLISALVPLFHPAVFVVNSLFIGGLMVGCRRQQLNRKFNFQDMFSGFEKSTADLCIVGLLYFSFLVVLTLLGKFFCDLIGIPFPGQDELNAISTGALKSQELINILLIPMLILLGFQIPAIMAFWFAPALIVFGQQKPLHAMILSLKACSANTMPFLVFGIAATIWFFIALVAIILLASLVSGFGTILVFIFMLSILSITITAIYASFYEVFPLLKPQSSSEDEDEPEDSLIA